MLRAVSPRACRGFWETTQDERRSVSNFTTEVADAEKRSKVMAAVRSKNAKLELIVRSGLHVFGYRFRHHPKGLPGQPNIVLRKYSRMYYPIVVSNTLLRCAGNSDY